MENLTAFLPPLTDYEKERLRELKRTAKTLNITVEGLLIYLCLGELQALRQELKDWGDA